MRRKTSPLCASTGKTGEPPYVALLTEKKGEKVTKRKTQENPQLSNDQGENSLSEQVALREKHNGRKERDNRQRSQQKEKRSVVRPQRKADKRTLQLGNLVRGKGSANKRRGRGTKRGSHSERKITHRAGTPIIRKRVSGGKSRGGVGVPYPAHNLPGIP